MRARKIVQKYIILPRITRADYHWYLESTHKSNSKGIPSLSPYRSSTSQSHSSTSSWLVLPQGSRHSPRRRRCSLKIYACRWSLNDMEGVRTTFLELKEKIRRNWELSSQQVGRLHPSLFVWEWAEFRHPTRLPWLSFLFSWEEECRCWWSWACTFFLPRLLWLPFSFSRVFWAPPKLVWAVLGLVQALEGIPK